jgi:hypothetical protein
MAALKVEREKVREHHTFDGTMAKHASDVDRDGFVPLVPSSQPYGLLGGGGSSSGGGSGGEVSSGGGGGGDIVGKVQSSPYCSTCGKKASEGTAFCDGCGAKMG